MYPLFLTDWDCLLIRIAVLGHVSNILAKPNKSSFNKHIVKAYIDATKQRHHVNWSNSTRKALLNFVSQLSSYDKVHNIGMGYGYNPHDYRALLNKLEISINH